MNELGLIAISLFVLPSDANHDTNMDSWFEPEDPERDLRSHETPNVALIFLRHICIENHIRCGSHGTCALDSRGRLGCRCYTEEKYVWGGKNCDKKGEILPVPSEYLFGLTIGVVVALLVALVAIVTYSYCGCRRKHNNRRTRDENVEAGSATQPTTNLPSRPSLIRHGLAHTIRIEQRETAFNALPQNLPSYTDAVPTSSRTSHHGRNLTDNLPDQSASWLRSETTHNDDVADIPDNASDMSAASTSASSSFACSIASDVLYRDNATRMVSYDSNSESSDEDHRTVFTLPRVRSNLDCTEARSMSSLACEDTLSQLSDTYHNRTSLTSPDKAVRDEAAEPPASGNAERRISPEKTYRVLLMGSLGPEPVFLYEPWRSKDRASTTPNRSGSQHASQAASASYGYCTDWDLPRRIRRQATTTLKTAPHRKPHTQDNLDVHSDNSSDTVVPDLHREDSTTSTETLLPSELNSEPVGVQSDSESDASVFFDENTDTYVKSSAQTSLSQTCRPDLVTPSKNIETRIKSALAANMVASASKPVDSMKTENTSKHTADRIESAGSKLLERVEVKTAKKNTISVNKAETSDLGRK